jgi:glutathione S-transferase
MSPTLYHVPKTISSPIFQALLELELTPSTVEVVTLTFADIKGEAHLAINPMGSSPAFQDGDTILWESGAVLNYLLEEYDTEYKLYAPPRSAKRAKYLHLQQFIIATIYPFVASLYIHSLKDKSEQDESCVTSAKEKWRDLLAPILIKWLGDGPYFLGDQLSVVDLLTSKPLSNINSMGMLGETPTLKALFDDISARPSFQRAYGSTQAIPDQPESRTFALVLIDAYS